MKREKDNRINVRLTSVKIYLIYFIIFSVFLEATKQITFISDVSLIIIFAISLTVFSGLIHHFTTVRYLEKLGEAARKIAKGDFSVRIAPRRKDGRKDYLEVLFDDFNTMTEELAEANEKLKALSVTDELTKLDNRRSFLEYIDLIWKQNRRLNLPVTVIMLDIDYFKKYNDSLGHLQGDKALAAIAECIKNTIKRETDFTARYGGEEFICVLPFVDRNEALNFAQTLVKNVEELKLAHPQCPHSKYVTISAGAATAVPDDGNSYTQLIEQADKALYAAKEAGRNRVVYSTIKV